MSKQVKDVISGFKFDLDRLQLFKTTRNYELNLLL